MTRSSLALRIHSYSADLAHHFSRINSAWVEEMFTLEDSDRAVLGDPQQHIVDRGGDILFVEADGLGIVGAAALKQREPGVFELTKMGVDKAARGRKAGEFLLAAMIERARQMGVAELYLLTNRRCEAAIHLYEKAGFVHDAEIKQRYGADYARCDVAMRYPLSASASDRATESSEAASVASSTRSQSSGG